MALKVVGAGVGRTGTASLKQALEQLLGGRCHHMLEIIGDPAQAQGWTNAIDGGDVDWQDLLSAYVAQVDWPGASFWREISAANPDALVLLSTREADAWYRSASNTIFHVFGSPPSGLEQWFAAVQKMFKERFSDDLGNATAMMDAFERHNAEVRAGVPRSRLLEWTPSDGWEPICERLGVAVPNEPFPVTNSTNETRALLGMPPLRQEGDPAASASDPAALASDPAASASDPAALASDPAASASDPAASASDPAALASDPAALASDPAALASDPAALASDPARHEGPAGDARS
jgi:Sulfotransferase domain